MKNTSNTIAMRNLINESEKSYGIAICPGRDENIAVIIPQVTVNSAAKELVEDQNKLMAWFGLDMDNTVSEYGLSVNSQDILNGRLKNAKHFIRTLDAWYDANVKFCGLMYHRPNGCVAFCKDDWWHMMDIMRRYGSSYAFLAIGEMSSDKKSVVDIRFYLMDFSGTVYVTEDIGEAKIFRKDDRIREKFMNMLRTETEAYCKSHGLAY